MTTFAPTESVRTPEGFDLRFGRATAGERLLAVMVDLFFVALASVLAALVLGWTLGIGAAFVATFLLRHGWFVWFETRWNGRTPGKRMFHLRVVRADGGPLTVETVLARNLTREVELFLPLQVLLAPEAVFGGGSGWVHAVAVLWILGFLFFPLSNPLRLRIGDLLAGTRVVLSPRVALARDLADAKDATFRFTPAQLSIYGERELAVLEDVLRKAKRNAADPVLAEVTKSICRRIDYADPSSIGAQHARFLREFYRAQRQHLEHRLLLGKRRLEKVAKRKRS